jgi:hypothetical protein
MSSSGDFGNPLRKFKLVFLGEQSGECYSHTAAKRENERERERERERE